MASFSKQLRQSNNNNTNCYQNQMDAQECFAIYNVLMDCDAVEQLASNTVKEIAEYATGVIMECSECSATHSVMFGNTMNENELLVLCEQTNYKHGQKYALFTKLRSDKGFLSYNYQKYICAKCLPLKMGHDSCKSNATSQNPDFFKLRGRCSRWITFHSVCP